MTIVANGGGGKAPITKDVSWPGGLSPDSPEWKAAFEGYGEVYHEAWEAAGGSATKPVPIERARQIIGAYQAGKTSGLSAPQISAIRSAPSLDSVISLANSYGIKAEDLGKILQGSYLETAYKQQFPSVVTPSLSQTSLGPTLSLSDAERASIEAYNAQVPCAGGVKNIRTYKVGAIEDGEWVDVYVEATDERMAKTKAKDAGYDVKRVTWSPSYTEKPVIVSEREVKGDSIKLDSGEWVSREMYDNLPVASQTQLNKLGVDKYNQWIVDEAGKHIETSGSQYLIDAYESGGIDGYNTAVEDYNQVLRDVNWLKLYNVYESTRDKEWGKDNWKWFQKTYADKLNDKKYMDYIQSAEFHNKYVEIVQPSGIPDSQYNLIKDYITTEGFDSAAALNAGKDSPSKAAQIIVATNKFLLVTASDETKAKLNSGEWTLLPYGQIIETSKLEQMPPTYRQIVTTSGLCGLEDYQEKVQEWNKAQSWYWNIIDALGANSVRLGQVVKNFALLELSASYGEVKEGDPKPVIDPTIPGAVNAGYIGFTKPVIGTYTTEEAAALNAQRANAQKYYKDLYDAAEMAAQEWIASRPYLQSVYPAGFVDSVREDPSSLKDPTLWGETIAATLPYTVATGIIVAGAAFAGPVGVAAGAPLAFAITMSVEGNGIYQDAIANGASHDQALKLANTYGAISAAIETLGDTIFVGALGFASGAFSNSLGKNVGGNIIREAAKKYGWKKLTADVIKDFVNQGGQEFFQEVVHNAAIKTVNENQSLLENTANAFVSGVIGTAPFVLWGAGGQAIQMAKTKLADVRVGKEGTAIPSGITPQMQIKILNKVFAPVSGFTVDTKTVAMEQLKGTPAEIAFQKQQYKEGKGRKIYEADREISIGLVDKKTIIMGKEKVNETDLAYREMMAKVNEYALTELTLKQAQKAIADFGLAKSEKQLKTLNEYKKRAQELEAKLKELRGPMVEAVRNFSGVFLKNSVGLESQQKAEVKEMAKTIVTDIDAVTSQLFGERNAKEIAKDVKELEAQIKVIEEEMAKGMTREQLEGYARLINILNGQVNDLVNELRLRYLSEGEKIKPDTKKLTMEVMSLQVRLTRAVEALRNFSGSALNYDVYRKGELATKGEVVKLERDTFEAVQRTTEAIWGRESYTSVLEQLNRMLGEIVASMESLKSQKAASKAAFKIYDAIKEQDAKALKEGVRLLQLEAGKIKNKPLQLQAAQQVKLLETLTMDNFWGKFKESKPKKEGDVVWYKSSEMEAEQKSEVEKKAERIVATRLERLLDRLPEYIRRWKSDEVKDYLRRTYDKQYFQDTHFGEFEDLDDYLSVDREMERIVRGNRRQEQFQTTSNQVEIAENELKLAKDLRDKAEKPKWRSILDDHVAQREREVEHKKETLKTITKTKLVIPAESVVETTKTQEERGVALTPVKEEELTWREKETAERNAAQRIRIAKKQIMEAGQKVEEKEKQRESAFPGIRPKTARDRQLEYRAMDSRLSDYLRTMTLAQALKIYSEEVGDEQGIFTDTTIQDAIATGIYAFTKAQTRNLTKTQIQSAVQTAVQTALQLELETETVTKEQLETVTKLITEIVTKTVQVRILVPPPPLSKGKKKEKHGIPEGSIAWQQGEKLHGKELRPQVYYITPPWTQQKPISLDFYPVGFKLGDKTPKGTIQMIGKPRAKVPKSVSIDLGVVDIFIEDYGQSIRFTGHGEETKVGKSLNIPTRGMSIPATSPMRVAKFKRRVTRKAERVVA